MSCYRNNVLIDSKIHAFAEETKKQGHFLKDFLPHSQNEEFESYNADNYNTSKESEKGKKTHICAYCEKYFTDKSNLSRHIRSIHEDKKPNPGEDKLFKCEICDYSASRKSNLKLHVASVHEGKKHFKCEMCDYCCFLKGDLIKHIESVHEGKKSFKCELCDYSCTRKDNMKTHVASVHEKKKPFKCEMCDYCCSLKGDLNKHFRRKHIKKVSSEVVTNSDGIEIKPKVKNTRKTPKNTDEIFLYPYVKYISINEEKKTVVQCLCCNTYTQRKGLVFKHLRSVHQNEINWNKDPEKVYDCETGVCKKLYGFWYKQLWCTQCTQTANMEKKEKIRIKRTGPDRKKYFTLCPDCGKNVENLSQHRQAVHINEEHKCPVCDKVFNSKRYVHKHVKAVHEKTPCVECGILVSNMKRHISRQHTSNDDKKFKCEVCGKGFMDFQNFQDHMNIHTGEKPYKCKHCSACFASRGNHTQHERSHIGSGLSEAGVPGVPGVPWPPHFLTDQLTLSQPGLIRHK